MDLVLFGAVEGSLMSVRERSVDAGTYLRLSKQTWSQFVDFHIMSPDGSIESGKGTDGTSSNHHSLHGECWLLAKIRWSCESLLDRMGGRANDVVGVMEIVRDLDSR